MLSIAEIGPSQPCPAPFNMAAYVLSRAAELADKPALEVIEADHSDIWTYRDLETAVRGVATGLLAQGLQQGDHVLMRLGNTPEFPLVYLACIAVGLIPVPTSPQLTASEVAGIVAEIKPKLVVVGGGIALSNTLPCPVLDADTLIAMRALPPADYAMGDPDRLAYIIYTSGTSGVPRAVCHAHRAIWARRMMWDGWYGLQAEDRLLHAGAFNWTYTLGTGLMDPWAIGATALIPAPGTKPADLPRLMSEHCATIFAAAPGVYRQMLKDNSPITAPTLRHGLSAGEKLSDVTRKRWQDATGTQIHEAFGMSECSTFLSGSPTCPAPKGTSGHPQPGRKLAILGDDGTPSERGTPGTIAISRDDPGLMLGYLNQPDETAARMQGDWFLTGDQGAMGVDGAVTYLGRNDDMMNAGGYRVAPLEIEAVLATHPDIPDCAVTDVAISPETRLIAAFYTADHPIDEQTLREFTAIHLAAYKCPRIYQHVPALPRSANGKLLRRILRETYEAQNGQA